LSFVFAGCDKTELYDLDYPAAEAHFTGSKFQTYSILVATPPVYNVEVGTTDVTNQDRQVTYKITSPTGAVGGTHYTIATGNTTGTVTIPAGQAVANLAIQGLFAPYNATGRKDTLVITLAEPSIKASAFMDTVKLALRGPCFEGLVNLNDFIAGYSAIETFGGGAPYGPYSTSISAVNLTSPTTGTVTVRNIWDNGWGPIDFVLDWTNPANRTVTVVSQAAIPGSNAGDLNAAYAGMTVAVRAFLTPTAANVGTFSACSNTFTLRMQLGVTGVGYFSGIYEVKLTR
jgi:hypothetical protein